jgi:hypothetical protein
MFHHLRKCQDLVNSFPRLALATPVDEDSSYFNLEVTANHDLRINPNDLCKFIGDSPYCLEGADRETSEGAERTWDLRPHSLSLERGTGTGR